MAFAYESWGRFPKARHARVMPVYWRDEPPRFEGIAGSVLPYAYGRSYGDSCLNAGQTLIDVSFLRRFIAFDERQGLLRCEAGVPFGEVLGIVVPRGWFIPVTPGTQYVSVGGAIANDIHGKNHHNAGTFGCHVAQFELLRSSGERFICSPNENADLFRATIGGLGLTGIILWAQFRLKPVTSAWISMEQVRFSSLEEFFGLAQSSDRDFEYTVAWIDCLARGKQLGRGVYLRGNHEARQPACCDLPPKSKRFRAFFDMPSSLLNGTTMRLFNSLFYHAHHPGRLAKRLSYEHFFFHLDGIRDWNRLYGKRGLIQYQCALPPDCGKSAIAELLKRIARSGEGAFLSILKRFGQMQSPGLLSFPRPGFTMAFDFPNRGARTQELMDELNTMVRGFSGAVYPAKDACMSAENFQAYYPQWKTFARFVDPRFSSSFWRRVTATAGGGRP